MLCLTGCDAHTTIRLLERDPADDDSGTMVPPGDRDGASSDAASPVTANALVTRYDFEGTGTTVVDRVGSADGELLGGASLDGSGGAELDGVDDFVDLPNGLISRLDAATVMVWLRWDGGICWQRVFDFGSSDQPEGEVGAVQSAIFVTPFGCGGRGMRATFELGDFSYSVSMVEHLPEGRLTQVTLTMDPGRDRIALYLDSELVAEGPGPIELSQISDSNVWLGRSQWVQDYHLQGRYEEVRIYAGALDTAGVREAFLGGPDAP